MSRRWINYFAHFNTETWWNWENVELCCIPQCGGRISWHQFTLRERDGSSMKLLSLLLINRLSLDLHTKLLKFPPAYYCLIIPLILLFQAYFFISCVTWSRAILSALGGKGTGTDALNLLDCCLKVPKCWLRF